MDVGFFIQDVIFINLLVTIKCKHFLFLLFVLQNYVLNLNDYDSSIYGNNEELY